MMKDNGIPMVMTRVTGTDGRSVAAYQFGDPNKISKDRYFGRSILGKKLKSSLVHKDGSMCALYLQAFPEAQLQIDHRVPFQVAGDNPAIDQNPDDYMLLCPSANRAKSWSCEHCKNWIELKDPQICAGCYWAHPNDYSHVAMKEMRRIDVMWVDEETKEFDAIKEKAQFEGKKIAQFIKDTLRQRDNRG